MKKLFALILLLSFAMTSCSQSIPQPADDTTPMPIPTPQTTETTEETYVDPYEAAGMPFPFDGWGGDAHWFFVSPYKVNFLTASIVVDEIILYLGLSDEEFNYAVFEKMGSWDWAYVVDVTPNYLLKSPNLLWYIINFDIPDEAIIEGIKKHNEQFDDGVNFSLMFSDEDIAALLSREAEKVNAQFAEVTVIAIGDSVYTPDWLYLNKPDDYRAAGITPEMVAEKLELYDELIQPFTARAADAFEAKLSEFTGREVRLRRG